MSVRRPHHRTEHLPPETAAVMRRFFAGANRSFRAAGMRDLQMAVRADGSIDSAPSRPRAARVINDGAGATILWKRATDDHSVRKYRVYRDGELIATLRGTTWFTDPAGGGGDHRYEVRAVDDSGLEGDSIVVGANDAVRGASGARSGNGAARGATKLAVPKFDRVAEVQPGVMGITWAAVKGAVAYGVYQNGKLVGHVTNPLFAAKVAGSVGIQIDAVAADGSRSARTAVAMLTPTGKAAATPAAAGSQPAADAMAQANSGPGNPAAAQPAAAAGASTATDASGTAAAAGAASTQPQRQGPPAGYAQSMVRGR